MSANQPGSDSADSADSADEASMPANEALQAPARKKRRTNEASADEASADEASADEASADEASADEASSAPEVEAGAGGGGESVEALTATVNKLQEDSERMRRTIAAQTREIERLSRKAGELPTGSTQQLENDCSVETSVAPIRTLLSGEHDPNDFGLAMILPGNIYSIADKHTFKGSGFQFPHRVQPGRGGARQYVVESRLLVYISCQLRNIPNNVNATELDLVRRGAVTFKLEILYARTGEVVDAQQLKCKTGQLTQPSLSQISTQRMAQGALKWKFLCKFLSRNTRNPSGQEFIFRVSCCNPELDRYNLVTDSPPFLVVSREVKEKAKK